MEVKIVFKAALDTGSKSSNPLYSGGGFTEEEVKCKYVWARKLKTLKKRVLNHTNVISSSLQENSCELISCSHA